MRKIDFEKLGNLYLPKVWNQAGFVFVPHRRKSHAARELVCAAIAFDGSTDYGLRTGLTGEADGKQLIMSFWAKFNTDGALNKFFANDGYTVLWRQAANIFEINAYGDVDGTGDLELDLTSTDTLLIADGWNHILVSTDMTTSHMYINDVETNNENVLDTGKTIDWTGKGDWSIGATTGGQSKFDGDIAEFYVNIAEYLDFSVTTNRRKVISAGLKPVDMGSTGEKLTGTAPIIYCSVRPDDAASVFFVNKGPGGNFTDQGSIALAATSPSD